MKGAKMKKTIAAILLGLTLLGSAETSEAAERPRDRGRWVHKGRVHQDPVIVCHKVFCGPRP